MFDFVTHLENIYSNDRAISAFEIYTFYCGLKVIILEIENEGILHGEYKSFNVLSAKGIPYHAEHRIFI